MATRAESTVSGRSAVLRDATRLVETPLGPVLVTVNDAATGEPAEVFVRAGKAGTDLAGVAEAIGRLCSLCLRLPSPTPGAERLGLIVDELAGIGGAGRALDVGVARSLPDAVARALADAVRAGTRPDVDDGAATEAVR
jgi:ribonucleoside-diphosphate reductase alpha chain